MKKTGAAIAVSCLLEQGVDTVFGYPGVSILRIYDELFKNRRSIRHILTAHEQGAAHAADGYARATGKTGVCLATSGPGATNLITGMAAAFMDSSPVVFITCNVPERLIGRDAFQEVDITGIAMPITKYAYLVRNTEQVADTIREAFALASSGRPGPVLVDIMGNAVDGRADYEYRPGGGGVTALRASRLLTQPKTDRADVEKLAELLRSSKRPLLLAGGGVIRSGASAKLVGLAEQLDIPVACTMMGLGSIPSEHPLFMGMAGVYGDSRAGKAIEKCDLLAAFGTRFSDRVTGDADFAPNARIVHVDVDRSEIDKNVKTDCHIVGDAGRVAAALAEITDKGYHGEWIREAVSVPLKDAGRPAELIRAVQRASGDDAVVVTDVGQHQLWTCRSWKFKRPGSLITSGGFGAMGFGLGAALGAKAGEPARTVVHITGDGSFGMNLTELATERRYGLDVITVVMDNGALGMVRQNQKRSMGGRYSQTTLDRPTDFAAVARAMGLEGMKAATARELEECVTKLVKEGRGGVIDCAVDIDDTVE